MTLAIGDGARPAGEQDRSATARLRLGFVDVPVQDRQCFCFADPEFAHASREILCGSYRLCPLRCRCSGHEGPMPAPRFDEPSQLKLSIGLCNCVDRQAEIGGQLSHCGQPDGLLEAPATDGGGKLHTHLLERRYRGVGIEREQIHRQFVSNVVLSDKAEVARRPRCLIFPAIADNLSASHGTHSS
jgi:hypothetical protein